VTRRPRVDAEILAREVPAPLWLLDGVEEHARHRGGTNASASALRYRNGRPLSVSRFSTLFNGVGERTDWISRLDVGIHWIRHTTLIDVEIVAGLRVAAAYAGHSDESLGVTGRYA
jgi:hypothetical protein